ncbi:MucR family transcriptional regulator [Klebsiella pneumoniae]
MADHDDAPEKIKCLECGKEFSFLAPHLSKAHQMNARQYRERWGIPLHRPLASAEHSRQCRENVLRRIRGSKRESQKIPSFRMMKIQSTPRLT